MVIKLQFDDVTEMVEFFELCKFEYETPIEAEDTNPIIQPAIDTILQFDDQEENTTTETMDIVAESDKHRIPYNERYKYDFYKCYFKTPIGRGGRILLTGSEALEIIPLINEGKGARSIFNIIGEFYHDEVCLSTINSLFRKTLV